jgi:hypothetical protein
MLRILRPAQASCSGYLGVLRGAQVPRASRRSRAPEQEQQA